ncbi:WhiB family transcriptional regulator [Nakamurella sp. GG22]
MARGKSTQDMDRLEPRAEYLRPWQEQAACRGADSGLFFPPDAERKGARTRREARAKALCVTCPVLEACRSHALRVGEPAGIWGALTEDERLRASAAEPLPAGRRN